MKTKISILMFSLLLAVGWTGNAWGQALPEARVDKYIMYLDAEMPHQASTEQMEPGAMLQNKEFKKGSKKTGQRLNAPLRAETRDMVSLTADEAKDLKYSYVDYNGQLHENVPSTEVADDPCQMYSLLRYVYMTKDFPGPYTSAYTAAGVPEREVYYGGIAGGWNIAGQTTTSTIQEMPDINIVASNTYAYYRSITVYDENNNVLTSWNYNGSTYDYQASSGTNYVLYNLPPGWSSAENWLFAQTTTNNYTYGHFTSGSSNQNTLVISHQLLEGHSSVRVSIVAARPSGNYSATVKVNNGTTQTLTTSNTTYNWTITPDNVTVTNQVSDFYKPKKEGYTVLVVSVKNNTTKAPDQYNPYEDHLPMSLFNDSTELVEYFKTNVNYIKLLTDGLRISDANGNPGTVFNCDGTYNRFFFLGKGQAREKDPEVIRYQRTYGLMGERVPFKEMYEEFSPTQGEMGSEITDFYDRMREGDIYDVVHDCGSVIENGHQFSMSGNNGVTSYPLTGLNFFVPDYRLAYWVFDEYYISYTDGTKWGPFTVDGRTMNPYYEIDGDLITEKSGSAISVPSFCVNYAQYNPQYAPKVGIYKITLDATATFVGDAENPDHSENNLNYVVTLNWVSSLNEMSGTTVPQSYTIYCYDNVTGERFELEATGVVNPTGETTVSYLVPQREHSYTIEYIIEGRPKDTAHPSFVAWSNRDYVVIPGWDDFIGLQLDHHESDFEADDMANYYRNFLEVVNQDIFSGLTVDKITGANGEAPMKKFTLYRFLYDNNNQPIKPGIPIATLEFGTPTAEGVPYTITYINSQDVLETPKYDLDETHLNIPLTGTVRIKGNGDIVIWPNSYRVNFKSIKIYNGNNLLTSWDYNQDNLPNGWIVSPGSEWEVYYNSTNNDKVGYMEGGGYIAIPNITNNPNYTDLRVEIEAYGDGSSVSRIMVNDHRQTIANGIVTTYKWGGNGADDVPLSPFAAPRRDNNNNNSNN